MGTWLRGLNGGVSVNGRNSNSQTPLQNFNCTHIINLFGLYNIVSYMDPGALAGQLGQAMEKGAFHVHNLKILYTCNAPHIYLYVIFYTHINYWRAASQQIEIYRIFSLLLAYSHSPI